jgi:hypothetical protein
MKTVALLLDDPENRYQQILQREAEASAEKHHVRILRPEYAEGSSWSQLESINRHLRGTDLPDALLILVAGEHFTRAAFERVVKKGMALLFLTPSRNGRRACRRTSRTSSSRGSRPTSRESGGSRSSRRSVSSSPVRS